MPPLGLAGGIPTMAKLDWEDVLYQHFDQLSEHNQLLLIERLVRRMRQRAFVDPEEFDRQMEAMSKDANIRRELGLAPLPCDEISRARPDVA